MMLTFPRLRPMLMGGASLAVIAVAILAIPPQFQRPDGIPMADAPQTAIIRDDLAMAREAVPTEAAKPAPAPTVLDQSMLGGTTTAAAPQARRAEPLAVAGAASPAEVAASSDRSRSIAPPAPQPGEVMGAPEARVLLAPAPLVEMDARAMPEPTRDQFEPVDPGALKVTRTDPVSTFSVDVDTASYAYVRRALMEGVLPPPDAVRIEELVNYFDYGYPAPETAATPFRADLALMPTPWNPGTQLLRIGIAGYELPATAKPQANLVFLIDTSGSMAEPDKLPLLLTAFRLLVDQLAPDDTVGIVAYAGSAGVVLEPTPVRDKAKILASLERLEAGGSTAGAEGIEAAYALAERHFRKDGVNRVLLATDGDFNVGISDPDALEAMIAKKRDTGVMLSVLGFGRGNLDDQTMQRLAQNGNGTAAYIDTLAEAQKVLVEDAASTLFPIASDVKIQVEFNPSRIAEYRLIGYETRALATQDFNNDRVDAGDIGSGHQVTALYELTPVGSPAQLVDPLRYGTPAPAGGEELGFLKIRAKTPGAADSQLWTTPITDAAAVAPGSAEARELSFAAAVAGFGQLLTGNAAMGSFGYDDVARLAGSARGDDPFGDRAEFLRLVRIAAAL